MVQGHDYVKMATSVIDYVFRDLAISYLKRSDLGQVKPEDLVATTMKNDNESADSKPKSEKGSAGFRPNSVSVPAVAKPVKQQPSGNLGTPTPLGNSPSGISPKGLSVYPSSAQPQSQVAVMEETYPQESEVIKIVQARIKGYEGDPCSSCGSFTLVRNGTCMKCDTCGSTTGCS